MFSANKNNKLFIAIGLVLAVTFLFAWLWTQLVKTRHQQLSVKPPSQFSNFTLKSIESTLGLHIKLPYDTLKQTAEQATTKAQIGKGEKQTCKRVLGINACATLIWQYRIERSGDIKISRRDNSIQLLLPLSLDGNVTVDGRGGKLLGLRNKKINGQLELIADLNISVGKNWCPVLTADLNYRWLSDPMIKVAGKFKINLRKSADKTLQRKLQDIEQKFTNLIDCSELRTRIAKNWKVHHLPIKIPNQERSFLELTPRSVAISDTKPMDDHLSMAFEVIAFSKVTQNQVQPQPLALPDLSHTIVTPGSVEFNLLFNLTYDQIRKLVSDKLLDPSSQSVHEQFTITSFDLYPFNERLIFDLGFKTKGYAGFFQTSGNLYLSAKPVADPDSNSLRFDDLQFTRIIDSDLWSAFSTVLHNQILETLKKSAVVDLSRQVDKLEQSITRTLSDPTRTGGLIVQASPPEVRLVTVNPQADSLAAIIHVSTRLEAEIPPSVLLKK